MAHYEYQGNQLLTAKLKQHLTEAEDLIYSANICQEHNTYTHIHIKYEVNTCGNFNKISICVTLSSFLQPLWSSFIILLLHAQLDRNRMLAIFQNCSKFHYLQMLSSIIVSLCKIWIWFSMARPGRTNLYKKRIVKVNPMNIEHGYEYECEKSSFNVLLGFRKGYYFSIEAIQLTVYTFGMEYCLFFSVFLSYSS